MKLKVPKNKIADFCRRNKIKRFSLFGSVLREDFGPNSDIDVLVEFEPGARVGFFELFDMERELSDLFGGRQVDINTPNSVSRYFRDEILKEARTQYNDRA